MRVGTTVQVITPAHFAFHLMLGTVVKDKGRGINVVEVPVGFTNHQLVFTDDELKELS